MLVSDELASKVPISVHYSQRTLNYFFRLVSLETWLSRGSPGGPHLWFRHYNLTPSPSCWLPVQSCDRDIQMHPAIWGQVAQRWNLPSPQVLSGTPHPWMPWPGTFGLELNPLIRPECSQIIITNNMAVITAIIILLLLLLVPSYHFHLIIMLFMIWSLFK